jgi:uncharacterized membrane protein YeaQ/YmgE (transglycosylase-associated protein family)
MSPANDSLVVVLLIGLLAGSVAGNIVQVKGFDLATNLVVGIVGAFFGFWLLPLVHIRIGSEVISLVINATIGAIILILAFRLPALTDIWGHHAHRAGRGFDRVWGTPSIKD